MKDLNPEDAFVAIQQAVRKNIKTGQEELEVTMFDLKSTGDEDAVVTITAKEYEVNRRTAQSHEVEQATRKLRVAAEDTLWYNHNQDQ
jgi:hypothetical protein